MVDQKSQKKGGMLVTITSQTCTEIGFFRDLLNKVKNNYGTFLTKEHENINRACSLDAMVSN